MRSPGLWESREVLGRLSCPGPPIIRIPQMSEGKSGETRRDRHWRAVKRREEGEPTEALSPLTSYPFTKHEVVVSCMGFGVIHMWT